MYTSRENLQGAVGCKQDAMGDTSHHPRSTKEGESTRAMELVLAEPFRGEPRPYKSGILMLRRAHGTSVLGGTGKHI